MAESASARDPYGRLDASSERLRTNARWVAIAFGTVASVAFAGFAISDLGALDPEEETLRFAVAAAAAIVAVVCLGLGIAWASRLSSVTVTTTELRELAGVEYQLPLGLGRENAGLGSLITKENGWTHGYDTVDLLLDAYVERQERYTTAMDEYASAPSDTEKQAALMAAFRARDLHRAAVSDAKAIASAERLRRTSESARLAISAWLSLSILSVVAFVWAANPPAPVQAQLFGPQPTPASLELTDAAAMKGLLGDSCTTASVLILGAGEAGVDVVTVGGDGCASGVRLTIADSIGTVTPKS